ncbi:MAG: hypothetical protein QOG91_279 [Candidatus Parcubacteria bacterium]|jgi:hypothetical protein|nr:hypothetical protein [Candidatus Parcubacteria bacterium]
MAPLEAKPLTNGFINEETKLHFDRPHAGQPAHVDIITRFGNGIRGASKVKVGPNGEITGIDNNV